MFLKNKNLTNICNIINKKWEYMSFFQQKQIFKTLLDCLNNNCFAFWVNEGVKNINDLIIKKDDNKVFGEYNITTKTLYINENRFNSPNYKEKILSTLLHEVYHAYQEIIYSSNENTLYSKLYFDKPLKFKNHNR